MAHAAEDLSYEDLQGTVDPVVCKAVTSTLACMHLHTNDSSTSGDESFG